MSHKVLFLIAGHLLLLALLTGCRSTVPNPADFSERVQEIVREAEELSKDGVYFPPNSSDRKKLVEETATLLLDKAELELKYSGLPEYPEAEANVKEYLRLATCLLNAPRGIVDREVCFNWNKSLFLTRGLFEFFWNRSYREISVQVFWFTITGLPWGVYVGSQASAFLLDLFSFPKAISSQSNNITNFELDPRLVERQKALEGRLSWRLSSRGASPRRVEDAVESEKLIVTFGYALEGELHEIERWKLMIERGLIAGSKNTGTFFNNIEEDFYERTFRELRNDIKTEVTRRSGTLLGFEIKYFNHVDNKIAVVAKIKVALAPAEQNGFISFVRKQNGRWDGVVVDVEIPRPGIEEEEALRQSLFRTYGDKEK